MNKREKKIRLLAVGDIMFGEHPLCLGHGVDSVIKKKGPHFIFEKVVPLFREADILFGNLENMLLDEVEKTNRFEDKYLRGDKKCIEILKGAGFSIVNLANNHALQHGEAGLYGTAALLERYGIRHVGLVGSGHAIFEFDSLKLGFLGYCSDQQYEKDKILVKPLDLNRISEDIQNLKSAGANFIIISLHWGAEFVERPSLQQIRMGRKIIDMGANLILGHHSHVVQGIERYRGGVIAYSLGNFVSDMQWDRNLKRTMILSCEISRADNVAVKIVPVFINEEFQPDVDSGTTGEETVRTVEMLSDELNSPDINARLSSDDAYIAYVKGKRNVNRFEMYRHFMSHIHKYRIRTTYDILQFFFLKKLGKLRWTGRRLLAG